mmetsp:Transcript_43761/g.115749  ORF Transcript_43761/g.115749 Transcript_43761/m.115749 type:complete len:256 (+) Transcript_43761:502-1269(+)
MEQGGLLEAQRAGARVGRQRPVGGPLVHLGPPQAPCDRCGRSLRQHPRTARPVRRDPGKQLGQRSQGQAAVGGRCLHDRRLQLRHRLRGDEHHQGAAPRRRRRRDRPDLVQQRAGLVRWSERRVPVRPPVRQGCLQHPCGQLAAGALPSAAHTIACTEAVPYTRGSKQLQEGERHGRRLGRLVHLPGRAALQRGRQSRRLREPRVRGGHARGVCPASRRQPRWHEGDVRIGGRTSAHPGDHRSAGDDDGDHHALA